MKIFLKLVLIIWAMVFLVAVGLGVILATRPSKREVIDPPIFFPAQNNRPIPQELPKAPLDLPKPSPQPAVYMGEDFSKEEAEDLADHAQGVAKVSGDFKRALAAQYWAVEKGDDGFYNLSCYYAQNQKHDEAFYWLQRAAREEGVDPEHASIDIDLNTLRDDPRFPQVLEFLKDCESYWKNSKHQITVVYLPKGYDKSKPSAALLLLHGFGSRPADFLGKNLSQQMADALKIPLISISGTQPLGPKSFRWAEKAEEDVNRLNDALLEVKDKVNVTPGQLITLGFSQGAQTALEVAVRDSSRFAGAIVISPGADSELHRIQPLPSLENQSYVITVGDEEHLGNKRLASQDNRWLTQAKAKVDYRTLPEHGHHLPENFTKLLPQWVEAILKHRQSK